MRLANVMTVVMLLISMDNHNAAIVEGTEDEQIYNMPKIRSMEARVITNRNIRDKRDVKDLPKASS